MLVVEQSERRLLAGAQEVWLVGHAAQARHDVGLPLPHPHDDVEQTGASGAQDLGPLDGDLTRGSHPA